MSGWILTWILTQTFSRYRLIPHISLDCKGITGFSIKNFIQFVSTLRYSLLSQVSLHVSIRYYLGWDFRMGIQIYIGNNFEILDFDFLMICKCKWGILKGWGWYYTNACSKPLFVHGFYYQMHYNYQMQTVFALLTELLGPLTSPQLNKNGKILSLLGCFEKL